MTEQDEKTARGEGGKERKNEEKEKEKEQYASN